MHIALQGALTGLALGVLLIIIEYMFVKKAVEERAQLHHKKPQFEQTDRNRIKSVISFSFFIPPAFALGAWLIWG
jgi:uncharacterized membrane protein YvbJ